MSIPNRASNAGPTGREETRCRKCGCYVPATLVEDQLGKFLEPVEHDCIPNREYYNITIRAKNIQENK